MSDELLDIARGWQESDAETHEDEPDAEMTAEDWKTVAEARARIVIEKLEAADR